MKKLGSLALIILYFFSLLSPLQVGGQNETGYFIVTAYYSPLPDQKNYYTGTYESEIKLNGNGTNGASGKEVFSGMLAAPKNYDFGTKIYLEGLGIGDVQDRGGAIVQAGNRGNDHDRIDLWVGYGDEGLARALAWGKQTVKGYTVHSSQTSNIDISKMPAPDWAPEVTKVVNTVFDYSLGKGSDPQKVSKLQEFFKDLELYNGEINGVYNNKIIDIVYKYQIENEIIKEGAEGAGYWGKTTRDHFKKAYINGEFDKKIDNPVGELVNSKEEDIKNNEKKEENKRLDIPMVELDLQIFDKLPSSGQEIEKIFNILIDIESYNGEISQNLKDLENAILNYQLKKGIVTSKTSPGAGNYGPKTRESIKSDYLSFIESSIEKSKLRDQELEKQYQEKQAQKKLYERKGELEEKIRELQKTAILKAEKEIEPIKHVVFGDSSQSVRKLQQLLKQFGYFDDKDTAIFGEKTKLALMNFQADNKIIKSKSDDGAGKMTEETVNAFINKLAFIYLREEVQKSPELSKI